MTARTSGGTGRIDALLVMPLVATLSASGDGHGTAVLTSKATRYQVHQVAVAGTGRATVRSYDRNGRLLATLSSRDSTVTAVVAPGGFTVINR